MNTQLDCIPCFVRQSLEAARHAGGDAVVQERVVRTVCHWAGDCDMTVSPPAMAQRVHRLIREMTGNPDPYAGLKSSSNATMLGLLPELRAAVLSSGDPFAAAVRMAIAGNAIDAGAYSGLAGRNLRDLLLGAMESSVLGTLDDLRASVRKGGNILYLADNAGEIALDRLLIEQVGPSRVTLVVRGRPVLNDATLADAIAVGLGDMVEVVSNDSDAPGTLLPDCSADVQRRFADADMIVAKGQGNYETLSDVARPGVFFLLMAKCPVIAQDLGCPLRGLVVARGGATSRREQKPSPRRSSPGSIHLA